MAHTVFTHIKFKWYHFSDLQEADFTFIEQHFKFHPLDYDDLRDPDALPKLDSYKHYQFAIFSIPVFDSSKTRVVKQNLAVFISKDYIVSISRNNLSSISRFATRLKRSRRFKQEVFSLTTGYFLYALLDALFADVKLLVKELDKETNRLESAVYDNRTKMTAGRLGLVRRNLLMMRHVIDPQRIIIQQLIHAERSYLPNSLNVYFDDIKDKLDAVWVISNNLKNIIDGLFDVNEALLSHRTNDTIRLLTVISLLLMPPTLITGYYGMNTDDLPFIEAPVIISLIIVGSIFLFWFIIRVVDKK